MVEAARGPMLAVTEPNVRKITVMASTQLLKTELINNIVGYFIHQDPAPIMVIQPTAKLAEAWSKDRLDKMIRDTQELKERVADKKSRDSGNTILHKVFPGGHISIVGSNSPVDLASRPIRIVLADEVDKYPESAGNEGDPLKLIEERSATFWNRLMVQVCSPTIKGRSRIEQEYLQSDMRVYHVPCPHCGHADEMKWENVKWTDNNPDTAAYQCPNCTTLWTEPERKKAIGCGYYVATAPFNGHAGFKVNKLASPWEDLKTLVRKFLEAKGNVQKLKTFVNTQLAETWEEKGEAPEYMRLYERREQYPINTCPEGVMFLTAGADIQKDRIEVEIVGWGKNKESWSIDYRVLMGDTATNVPWSQLDKVLNDTWKLSSGLNTQIRILCVDSGYNTQHVYDWARRHSPQRVRVIKGAQDMKHPIVGTPKAVDVNHSGQRMRRGVKVWPLGVSNLKSELYSFLNLDGAGDDGIYPAGFCHFPEYAEEYFKQLTAEKLVHRKNARGFTAYEWVKDYERNEALDCRNYARAAAEMFGISIFKEQDWLIIEGQEYIADTPKPVVKPQSQSNERPQSSFWGNKKSIWNK